MLLGHLSEQHTERECMRVCLISVQDIHAQCVYEPTVSFQTELTAADFSLPGLPRKLMLGECGREVYTFEIM